MNFRLLAYGFVFLLVAVSGCRKGDDSKSDDDNSSPVPIAPGQSGNSTQPLIFAKNPASAVLESGIVGNPVFIADPGVVKDSSGYHLFITNQFCDLNDNGQWDEDEHLLDESDTLLCVAARGVGATMYAFSDDKGLTWTVRPRPAIQPGPAGWDNYNVETAFPFVHDDTLYVAYSAFGDRDGELFRTRYQIGLASVKLNGRTIRQAMIDDAVTLSKIHDGTQPLLPGNITTSSYDNNTQEPSVVVTAAGFELFYTGLKLSDPAKDLTPGNGNDVAGIALMRQKFDFNWTKTGEPEVAQTLEGMQPGTEQMALAPVNIGEVHYHNGLYHNFYTTLEAGADFHRGERIAHAVSADGLSWTNMAVIIQPGSTLSEFDGWGIMAPTVVFDEGEAVLFYSAWGTSENTCVMTGTGIKWGQQVDSGSKCVHGNLGRATAALQGN